MHKIRRRVPVLGCSSRSGWMSYASRCSAAQNRGTRGLHQDSDWTSALAAFKPCNFLHSCAKKRLDARQRLNAANAKSQPSERDVALKSSVTSRRRASSIAAARRRRPTRNRAKPEPNKPSQKRTPSNSRSRAHRRPPHVGQRTRHAGQSAQTSHTSTGSRRHSRAGRDLARIDHAPGGEPSFALRPPRWSCRHPKGYPADAGAQTPASTCR